MSQDQNWTTTPYGSPPTVTGSGFHKFPNPFFDIASEYIPTDLTEIFEWAEFIYLSYGTYRSVSRKVVRYFLTELLLTGGDEATREEFKDLLSNKMKIMTLLADMGDDYMVYGNSFISVIFPFDRFFICPLCGTNYKASVIPYKFDTSNGVPKFRANCPKCQQEVVMLVQDRRNPLKEKVRIKRWNPKRMHLRVHPVNEEIEYHYDIPGEDVKRIRDGEPFFLNSTPMSMIEVAIAPEKRFYQFKPNTIYHLKESTLAGMPIRGWGIPSVLANFRLAYYIQVLRRYDEAIAFDYIIPFRVLSPVANGDITSDPLHTMSMQSFVARMQGMIQDRRKDPTSIAISPFPIDYKMLGGEGKNLAPKESIALAIDELLNAIGYPAELYKGSLSIQAFPVALRLFERTWGALVDDTNSVVSWIVKSIANQYMLGDIDGRLRSVTLADDMERKALTLQAAAGMDISKGTAYLPLGLDFMEEQKKLVDEQKAIARLQQEASEDQEAQQASGSATPGPGGDPNATPGDVYEQAKQTAQQLLFQVPESLRRGELIKIKHSNPTLHALVLQEMNNVRQEMSRQGGAQMMQQQQQAAQGGQQMKAGELGPEANLPSMVKVKLDVTREIMDYSIMDLKKLAHQIKLGKQGSQDAFHFVYFNMRGWTT